MDAELLGEDVHEVNKLTVIANESYADFTTALQRETRDVLRERGTHTHTHPSSVYSLLAWTSHMALANFKWEETGKKQMKCFCYDLQA